jgi:ribose transport system substrate-binding protein
MRNELMLGSMMAVALWGMGCSSNAAPASSASGAAMCNALPPLAPKSTYTVGFSQLWEPPGNPWRETNTKSFQDEAKNRGWNLVYDPGTNGDSGEAVARFQALIDAKVDAIVVAPHDETTIAPSVVAARRACIPVFIEDRSVDTMVAIPGTDYVSNIGSDFLKEGQMTANWLIKKTGGQAKIIEIEGTVGSSPAVLRKKGFDELIAAQPGMSILVSQSGDFVQQKGHDVAAALIPMYPTATVIFSHNDAMSMGVIQAMTELGKVPGKDLLIVSIDGIKAATQAIIDGKIGEVSECNPKFGKIVFDTMVDYSNGKMIPTEIKNVDRVFDSTNAGDYLPEAY